MGSKMLFIKNTGMYDLTVSAVRDFLADDGMGGKEKRRAVYLTKTFGIRREDPATGRLACTGFTAITEEEFKNLVDDCRIFKSDLESGTLVKYDVAPEEALLDTELIASLQNDIVRLKDELAQAKKLLSDGNPEFAILAKENEELKARIKELEDAANDPESDEGDGKGL